MRGLLALLLIAALALSPASAQRWPAAGFADLAERLTPAVVNIATRQRVEGIEDLPRLPPGSPLARPGNEERQAEITSLGSGFIVSPDGVVVTNNHVIEAADAIDVLLQNGDRYQAVVVGRDPATDIAVLRIQTDEPLPYVEFGDSDEARVGDIVLAIGNPFGLGGSLSVGVVSARNRNLNAGRYDDFIQTDAAINRGNSGGPLFSTDGEVIGVNTAIVSPSGASIGVGFATPTSIVRPVVDQLIRYGEARRGWLGVTLVNADPSAARGGVLVRRVTAGGPAAAAGLRPDDVVVSFNGREVNDSRVLTRLVGEAQIGAPAQLDIVRGGRRLALSVTIARLEETPTGSRVARADAPPRLDGSPRSGRIFGIALAELDASLREEYQIEPRIAGVVVLGADEGGANEGVLQAGDVIEAMAFRAVDTIEAINTIAGQAAIGERAIIVRINRGGEVSYRRLRARS
jgi:serine protease Do